MTDEDLGQHRIRYGDRIALRELRQNKTQEELRQKFDLMQNTREVRERRGKSCLQRHRMGCVAGGLKWDSPTLRAALSTKSVQEVMVEHSTCQWRDQ